MILRELHEDLIAKGEIYLKKGPVTLIDDYGHHPTEIEATVRAARASWPEKKIVMIYQPL